MVQHIEPDDLALAALGEPIGPDAQAHLTGCARCTDELASLTSTVRTARTAADGALSLVPAPSGVWASIRDELDLTPGLDPETSVAMPTGQGRRAPFAGRRRAATIAAVAAAGVAIGGVGTAWWTSGDGREALTVVAEATLEPLPGWDARGDAVVEVDAAGDRVLVVTLDGAGVGQGFHEVWLISRDVTRLVSLGVLDGPSGTFTVPQGLD
ncbi:MAG: anti-sigma factor, partial [Cellulomonadaceae bacterium]|nr:anti-sigma factor [Cellulomonadaceae bacterium]